MNTTLERMGFTSDDLDETVIEAAGRMASNANNGGMGDQLSFLYQSGYSDEDIMVALLKERLKIGSSVDVTDPKSEQSVHAHAFSGYIEEINDETVNVVDQEGNAFEISFLEIENFI